MRWRRAHQCSAVPGPTSLLEPSAGTESGRAASFRACPLSRIRSQRIQLAPRCAGPVVGREEDPGVGRAARTWSFWPSARRKAGVHSVTPRLADLGRGEGVPGGAGRQVGHLDDPARCGLLLHGDRGGGVGLGADLAVRSSARQSPTAGVSAAADQEAAAEVAATTPEARRAGRSPADRLAQRVDRKTASPRDGAGPSAPAGTWCHRRATAGVTAEGRPARGAGGP